MAEEWANFNEDDFGLEEKRPHRTGSRADKVGVRGHKEQPRYTTVKDEVDEATAAGLKVGDHITANTSKGEYPGGHKSRAGKVTRVGQTGVHIRPDDGGEVEYHPYKIVKKTVKDKDVYEGWNNGTDRVQLADSTSAYWNGTGRLQAEYDELYKQLVPASGAAETLEGEVIRASSKIVYRHFNDGDEFNQASFDQLKPFIGSVTSYDDLAEKAIEFALRAQGNYHPNAGWDSLDVMDYGPSEEEEYDDEEDDEDYQDWEDPYEDDLDEGKMVDPHTDIVNQCIKKGYTTTKQLTPADWDEIGKKFGQQGLKFAVTCGFKTPNGKDTGKEMGEPLDEADMFKAGQRAIKNIKSTEQQRKSEANKMAQAQSQIDVDRENERDRFSQEELYPSDDSHDLDEGEYEDEDQGFFVAIGSEDNGGFVGMVTKDGGKWRESAVTGRAPYNWGGSYMGYLTPDDVMQWIQKDYRNYDVEGPFSSEEEAREHAQMQYGLDEAKHFKTAYGWAGGRNEKTGGTYKHPDQIKADREAKKSATAQQSKDAFNNMFGGNAADLTRDLKIREAASSDKLVARAHAIIRKHGDADMGHSEFMQLLTANGIPEDVAHQVASDYRPVSEGSSSYPTDANWDRSGQMDPLAKGIGPSRTRANPKSTAKDIEQANYQTKRAIKGRLGKEVAEGWGADTQKAESDRSAAAWDTLRAKYANDPAVIKRLNYLERMNWTAAAAEKKANAGEIKGINEDVTSTDPLEGALLNAIQELVSQGHKDVDPMVLTNMVVAATSRPFLLKDLVDANNNSLAVQHYIDSISPSKVKFSTDTLTVKNEDPSKDKAKARAGVSSMASRAANRSRLGENSVTPLRDKEDYTAKRTELQRIQLDPDTHKDPQLRDEVIRRLHSLNQQYSTLREQITKFKESRGHKAIATKLGNMDRMNNVQIPSPAERREQLRIAKAKEEAGKKQVKEFAAPGANPAPVVAPANDPAAKQQAQKIATATNTIKSATGSTVAAPVLATALDAASQGQANPAQVKAIAPIANVVDAATKDPKLAGQFKTLATQAQQSLKAQQKPQ